jgi:hypothetical protein
MIFVESFSSVGDTTIVPIVLTATTDPCVYAEIEDFFLGRTLEILFPSALIVANSGAQVEGFCC